MMVVVIYSPGPNWIVGQPVTSQKLATHLQYMKMLQLSGRLVLAGPFLDSALGGMAVLKVVSPVEASEIIYDDPAVRNGVLQASLRAWYIAVPEGHPPGPDGVGAQG